MVKPLLAIGIIGFCTSAAVHIAALFGTAQPKDFILALVLGVFPVVLTVILLQDRLVGEFRPRDRQKALLRGCPRWFRWILSGLGIYAVINLFVFGAAVQAGGVPAAPLPGMEPAPRVRMITGHLMFFYAAGIATLYSAIRILRAVPARHYPNEQPVPPAG